MTLCSPLAIRLYKLTCKTASKVSQFLLFTLFICWKEKKRFLQLNFEINFSFQVCESTEPSTDEKLFFFLITLYKIYEVHDKHLIYSIFIFIIVKELSNFKIKELFVKHHICCYNAYDRRSLNLLTSKIFLQPKNCYNRYLVSVGSEFDFRFLNIIICNL